MTASIQPYRKLLARYLKSQRLLASLLAALLFSNIILQLVNPQIMRRFIDTVQAGGALQTLLNVALLFLGVALAQQVVSVLATYVSENVGWTATNALRADLAEHCLNLDLSFHNARTPGEMIERIDGDVTALSNFFSRFIIQVIGNLLLLIGALVLLFCEDWRVGLSLTIFSAIVLVLLGRFQNIAVPYWSAERQASAELFGFLEERLSGTEDIRANGARSYVMLNFYRRMRTLMQRSLRAGLTINVLLNTMWILFALGNAVAFGLGAYLFQNKVITIGTVYIIFQYTTMLQRPIEELSRQVEDLQRAGASVTRVQELLNIRSKLLGYSPASSLSVPEQSMIEKMGSTGALEVQFEDVSFGYHDDLVNDTSEMVLHNLSFHIAPRKVVGLLGRTGSGKTSLTRLLFRLYDPDHGVICIAQHNIHPMYREISFPAPRGGDKGAGDVIHPLVDIRQISLDQLRQQIGMITQNIQLFNASVRDNLTFFDDRIPDDRILRAIRDLDLWGWYRSLPDGLDTELESGGGGLSAGEAQLLAFTRIFLKDPGLVILDEASSRLDPATENMISSAVERLVHDRTAIIVAHRLGTVQRADEIMILEDGRVCEYGPRLGLANDPDSHFSRLLQTGLEEVLV